MGTSKLQKWLLPISWALTGTFCRKQMLANGKKYVFEKWRNGLRGKSREISWYIFKRLFV